MLSIKPSVVLKHARDKTGENALALVREACLIAPDKPRCFGGVFVWTACERWDAEYGSVLFAGCVPFVERLKTGFA